MTVTPEWYLQEHIQNPTFRFTHIIVISFDNYLADYLQALRIARKAFVCFHHDLLRARGLWEFMQCR